MSPADLLKVFELGPLLNPEIVDQTSARFEGSLLEILSDALIADATEDQEAHRAFIQASQFVLRKLKLDEGEQALLVNGRVGVI